jgi:hypothetical protein
MREASKQTVAVVGSGMAGLVAAFLLEGDNEGTGWKCLKRYDYNLPDFVLEDGCSASNSNQQDQVSLDSASYTLEAATDDLPHRVDIPMRAFDDNYHINLKRMYDYLDVDYVSPKFLYSLSRICPSSGKREHPYSLIQQPPSTPNPS